jgi:type I restriction enzyme S subunit
MKTRISSFLKERPERFKPEEANKLNLKRLQKIDFSGNMHFLEDKKTNTNMVLIKSGDLVISGINVEKGAVAVYQGYGDVLATIHYSSYEFDKNKIDIDYFKWFLKSDAFRNVVLSKTRGGIKTELKPKKFLPLEIDLPSLEEQRQILSKINSMKNEIQQLEQNVSHDKVLLKNLRSAILSEAVQGKLFQQNLDDEPASELLKKIKKEKLIKEGKIKKGKPLPAISSDEIPYELPKGWVWCRLGDVLEFIYGKGLTKENRIAKGEYSVYGSNGIVGNFNEYLTNKRAIIIGRKGSAGALNISELPSWTTDVAYYIEESENLDLKFTYYLLKTLNLESIGKGIKPGLNRNEAYILPIGLPPLSEQRRIVEKVDALMKFCDDFEDKIKENSKNSKVLMNGVLKEVFWK